MHRFGQNERSIFGFLQSLEPAGLQRFAHETTYAADQWYGLADVFDHIGATSGSRPSGDRARRWTLRSVEHTSELQSLMRISYAVFCLTKKNKQKKEDIRLLTSQHKCSTKSAHRQ